MPDEWIRILFLGDVFGKPGRDVLSENLAAYREEHAIDFCIANGENAAGGNGITPKIAEVLFKSGIDVITTGDHVWDRKEVEEYLSSCENILRPLNFPDDSPGKGMVVWESSGYQKICVINLIGRVFMRPSDSPFTAVERALREIGDSCPVTVVDFHAEATSEKVAMGRFLDGKVSAVLGTHTHIQTADETVLPGGTAYITDVGMTGPFDSVIGLNVKEVVANYRYHIKRKFSPARDDVRMGGVILEVDPKSGRTGSIRRVEEKFVG